MIENNQEGIEGKTGSLVVTVKRTQAGSVLEDTEKRESIEITTFVTNPAYVTFACSTTKNMGNYESLRMEVRVSLPCYIEEIDEMYNTAKDWVDTRLDKELSELTAAPKKL